MKKLVSVFLTGLMLIVAMVAQAVEPGQYFARRYHAADKFDAVEGIIQIRHLQGDASLPKLEFFCIAMSDGERPTDTYAGIINHHDSTSASGTIMFKLTAEERKALLKGDAVAGTWLKGINTTVDDVRFATISDTRISCQSMEGANFPIPYILPNEYRYLDATMGGDTEIAMKIVALAKIRGLKGESFNLRAQKYRVELTGYDTDLFMVTEAGEEKTFAVAENLTNIVDATAGNNRSLCSAAPEQGPFGNAICTGDDVLVRSTSSRAGEIVGVLNKGDIVKYYYMEEGETVGDSNKWAYVMLKNYEHGYVFLKYIQHIENR